MVREALRSALPEDRKKPERLSPQIARYAEWIEEQLKAEQTVPRKQRHTSHRIWVRLSEAFPEATVGESTLRHYVGERKRQLRLSSGAVMVPNLLHAFDGERSGVSLCVPAADAAGVAGGARAGFRLSQAK